MPTLYHRMHDKLKRSNGVTMMAAYWAYEGALWDSGWGDPDVVNGADIDMDVRSEFAGQGVGTGGSDTFYRLREGVERFLITDINNPAGSAKAQTEIHVLSHLPQMTGHHSTCQCCRDCCIFYVPVDQARGRHRQCLGEKLLRSGHRPGKVRRLPRLCGTVPIRRHRDGQTRTHPERQEVQEIEGRNHLREMLGMRRLCHGL